MSERFLAAREWASLSDPLGAACGSAVEAYQAAIDMLPRLAMLGLDVQSRQRALTSNTDGLARDAAAYAIRSGKIDIAIEFLEAGRTIFWSQALGLRTPLDDLDSAAPDLAQKLRNISRALEQGALRDVTRTISDPGEKVISMEQEVVRYRQLENDWLETIRQVRELTSFQDFLRPKSFADLSAAATNGPIVILNASNLSSQCDALVLRCSQEPVHVPLPGFTPKIAQAIIKRIRTLPNASFPLAREDRKMVRVQRKGEDADTIFRDVLATLWRSVVQPTFHVLNLEVSQVSPIFGRRLTEADAVIGRNLTRPHVYGGYLPALSLPCQFMLPVYTMSPAVNVLVTMSFLLTYPLSELSSLLRHFPSPSRCW